MTCKHCGRPQDQHVAVVDQKSTGTRFDMPPILICPTGVFSEGTPVLKTTEAISANVDAKPLTAKIEDLKK